MEDLATCINTQHRKVYSNDIDDDNLVPLFRQWCADNLCVENVDFFIEVAQFKRGTNNNSILFFNLEMNTSFRSNYIYTLFYFALYIMAGLSTIRTCLL